MAEENGREVRMEESGGIRALKGVAERGVGIGMKAGEGEEVRIC